MFFTSFENFENFFWLKIRFIVKSESGWSKLRHQFWLFSYAQKILMTLVLFYYEAKIRYGIEKWKKPSDESSLKFWSFGQTGVAFERFEGILKFLCLRRRSLVDVGGTHFQFKIKLLVKLHNFDNFELTTDWNEDISGYTMRIWSSRFAVNTQCFVYFLGNSKRFFTILSRLVNCSQLKQALFRL